MTFSNDIRRDDLREAQVQECFTKFQNPLLTSRRNYLEKANMSEAYKRQDPLDIAKAAERDLASNAAKQGHAGSTSTEESGIDQSVTNKFPGSTAEYGSKVSGAGNNREIPVEEGGDIQRGTGRPTKAGDFDKGAPGEGPEHLTKQYEANFGGNDDVRSNVKQ